MRFSRPSGRARFAALMQAYVKKKRPTRANGFTAMATSQGSTGKECSAIPTYVYRCPFCLNEQEAVRRIADRDDAPTCHNRKGERVIKSTMVAVFTPYQAVAEDKDSGKRPLIRNKAEHEAFLRRNGYEEVGNDKSAAPLSAEQIQDRRAQKDRAAREAEKQPIFDFNAVTHEAQQQPEITQ